MTHPQSETVTHHFKTFTHICVKIMTHHFMKMTDPWRTSFCAHRNDGPIDEPCDALTVKWLTTTHIWVSVVTNLLLPWQYYASSMYMTHPWRTIPRGSRGASYKWHLHNKVLEDLNECSSIFWKVQHSHSRHQKTASDLCRITLKGRLRVSSEQSLKGAVYIKSMPW